MLGNRRDIRRRRHRGNRRRLNRLGISRIRSHRLDIAAHNVVYQLLQVVHVFLHVEQDLIEDFALAAKDLLVILLLHQHRVFVHTGIRQILTQDGSRDVAILLDNGETLRDILQLADVAGPTVGKQHLPRLFVQTDSWHVVLLGAIVGKLAEKEEDILVAVAQGRDFDRHRVQSVIQVLAELALRDGLLQIHVRRCHDTHVGLLHLGRTDLDKLATLQDTEQAGLRGQREFACLVKEDGTAVGHFEIALAVGQGAGEGAFLVPEQLRVDGALRDSSAIDRDILSMLTRTELVDNLREDFLTDTTLARNQNRQIGGSHLQSYVDSAVQSRAVANHAEALFYLLNIYFHLTLLSFYCFEL